MDSFERFKSDFEKFNEYIDLIYKLKEPDKIYVERIKQDLKEWEVFSSEKRFKWFQRESLWFLSFFAAVIIPLETLVRLIFDHHSYISFLNCLRDLDSLSKDEEISRPKIPTATFKEIYEFLVELKKEEVQKVLGFLGLEDDEISLLPDYLQEKNQNAFVSVLLGKKLPQNVLQSIKFVIDQRNFIRLTAPTEKIIELSLGHGKPEDDLYSNPDEFNKKLKRSLSFIDQKYSQSPVETAVCSNNKIDNCTNLQYLIMCLSDEQMEDDCEFLNILDRLPSKIFRGYAEKMLASFHKDLEAFDSSLTIEECKCINSILSDNKELCSIDFITPNGDIDNPTKEVFELVDRWIKVKLSKSQEVDPGENSVLFDNKDIGTINSTTPNGDIDNSKTEVFETVDQIHIEPEASDEADTSEKNEEQITSTSKSKKTIFTQVVDKEHLTFTPPLPHIKAKVRTLAEKLAESEDGIAYLLKEDKVTFYFRICGSLVEGDTMADVKESEIKWGGPWPTFVYLLRMIYEENGPKKDKNKARPPKSYKVLANKGYRFKNGDEYEEISAETLKDDPRNSSKVSENQFPMDIRTRLDDLLKKCQLMPDNTK